MKTKKELYKVKINNLSNGHESIIDNVTKVKLLKDGRMFIHFLKFCETCKETQKMVHQVPNGYALINITHVPEK